MYIFRSLLNRQRSRLQLLLILTFVFASILAVRRLNIENRQHIANMSRLAATGIHADLDADLNERLRGQVRLAQLWDLVNLPSKTDWKLSASLYTQHYPGSLLVELVDTSYAPKWIYPEQAAPIAEALQPTAADELVRASRLAVETRQPAVTRVLTLPAGEHVAIAVAPVFTHGKLAGYIVDVMDVQSALGAMLHDVGGLGYEFVILQEGKVVYSLRKDYEQYQGKGGVYLEMPVNEFGWTLRVWPSDMVLNNQNSRVAWLLGTLLAALGVAVVAAMRSAEVSRRQRDIAQEAHRELVQETSQRHRAEESSRRSEAKFERILDISADAIVSVDADQKIVLFNQGAEKTFGYRADEVLGGSLDVLLPAMSRMPHRHAIERFAEEPASTMRMCQRRSIFGVRKSGAEFPLEATISKLETEGGTTFTAILRDISDRVRAEEALIRAHNELEDRVEERTTELAKANESLRQLSGRLLRSQEEERRRIARELHDSTAQILVLAMVDLERLKKSLPSLDDSLDRLLTDCMSCVERATGELRTVSYRLHPPMLEEFGLAFALRWYINGFSERIGISIEVDVDTNLGRLESDTEMTVFRIVQEALTNVHRHSGATKATVRITQEPTALRLVIADQGSGLRPDVLGTNESAPLLGVGIAGMRERVRQLSGSFEIKSGAEGTVITAVFPLNDFNIGKTTHGISA